MERILLMFKDKYIAHRKGIETVNLNLRKIDQLIETRAARGISFADLKEIKNHLILVKNKSNEDEETMRFRWKEIQKSCSSDIDFPLIEKINKLISDNKRSDVVQTPRKRGEPSSQQSIEEGGSHNHESPETDKQIPDNKSLNDTEPPRKKRGRPRKHNISYDNSACSTGSEPSKSEEAGLQSAGDTQKDHLQVPQVVQSLDKSLEELDTRKSLELNQSLPKKRGRPRKEIGCNSGCVGCDIKNPRSGNQLTKDLRKSTDQAEASNCLAEVVGGSPTMPLAELSDPGPDDNETDMITPISPPQLLVKYITSMHTIYYDKSAEVLGAADACSWYGRKPDVLPETVREKNKHLLRQCKTAVIVLDDFVKTCVPWVEEQDAPELSTDLSKTSSTTTKKDEIKKELNIKQNKGLVGLKIQPLTDNDGELIKNNSLVGRVISKRGDKSKPENFKNIRKAGHPPLNLESKKRAGGLPKSIALMSETKSKPRGINRPAVAMTAKTHSGERNASNDPPKNLKVPICRLRKSKTIETILKVLGAKKSRRRKIDGKTNLPKKVAPDFKDISRKGNLLVGMKISQPSTSKSTKLVGANIKPQKSSAKEKRTQTGAKSTKLVGAKIKPQKSSVKEHRTQTGAKSTKLVGAKIKPQKSSAEEKRTQTGAKYDRRSNLPDVIPTKSTSNNLLKDMLPNSLFKDPSNTSYTDFDLNGVIDEKELRPFRKEQKIANECAKTESIRVCEFAQIKPASFKEIVSGWIDSLETKESPENESTEQPIKLLFRNLGNEGEDRQNYQIVSSSVTEMNTEDTMHDKFDEDESGREMQPEDVPPVPSLDPQHQIAIADLRPPLKDYTRQRTANTAPTEQGIPPKTAQNEHHLTSNDVIINRDPARQPFPTPNIDNTNVLGYQSVIKFHSSATNRPGNMINESPAKIHEELPPLLALGSIPSALPSAPTTDSTNSELMKLLLNLNKN